MKRLFCFLLAIFTIFQFANCSTEINPPTSTSKETKKVTSNPFYQYWMMFYSIDEVLVNVSGITADYEIGSDISYDYIPDENCYYLLNLVTEKTSRVFRQFPGQIYFDLALYDQFDPNDFVTWVDPTIPASLENQIGRFQSSELFIPLVKDKKASMMFDSKKDNVVVYHDSEAGFSQEVNLMKRDGTNKKSISLGISAMIYDYHQLTKNIGSFSGDFYDQKEEKVVFILDQASEKITLLMENQKTYEYIGLIDSQMLIRVADIKSKISTFYLYDLNGNRKKQLFEIKDIGDIEEYDWFFDEKGRRLFYSYNTPDKTGHILQYDFTKSKLVEIFHHAIDYGRIPIGVLNQEKNFLSFLMDVDEKSVWFIHYLENGKIDEIPLPSKKTQYLETNSNPDVTDYQPSSDGKYILCMDISDEGCSNGIIDYQTKKLKLIPNSLDISQYSTYYSESTESFYFALRHNQDRNHIYSVNRDAEVKKLQLGD